MIRALLDRLRSQAGPMTEALATLVEHESPSGDTPKLDALAEMLASRLEAVGASTSIVDNPSGGSHLIARAFEGASGGSAAVSTLVLGHFDTVWPVGTLASMPFRVESGRASGPGVFDMKASLVAVEFALGAIRDLGLPPAGPVEILFTSDEETGSRTSRELIEERAREADRVFVVEPPLADGSLKTARKGVGLYRIRVEGRAAHAGVEPEKGVSAVDEAARLVLKLHALTDHRSGVSVNVGLVGGGTTPNVVAASATLAVDVRATTADQAREVDAAIRAIGSHHPEARIDVEGGFNRPPMERTEAGARLFEQARELGRSIGLDLGEGSTGGGSDGNFTAALGVPTLDGLGIEGLGAHARHEQVVLASLPERAALLAALLVRRPADATDRGTA